MTQTKQAKHTPGKLAYNHIAKVIVDQHGNCLASIHRSAQDEIGETIVRAVNSHEELLGALQDLLSEFKSRTALIETCDLHDSETNAMEKAEAAIAHATGE